MTPLAEKDLLTSLVSGYSLPTLSPVALKLVELAADETCSAKGLASFIEKDPSLAARLLKLANSAFFSPLHPVSTLSKAVVRVGFQRLRIMALTLSLRDTFPMGENGPMNYEAFWRTSLYRALIAKSLAEKGGSCAPEEAFTAGLILDIGLLILFDLCIREKGVDLTWELLPMEKNLALERKSFGMDHRQVGETALRHWRFPESIVICLRPPGLSGQEESLPGLAKICRVADACSAILFHDSKNIDRFFIQGERTLGLDSDVMNQILLDTFEQVEDIAGHLRLILSSENDLMEIMEKANRALGRISGVLADVSEKKLPSLETLEAADNREVHTLQAIAHEFRNPLMVVGGFAKKLTSTLEPSSHGGQYARVILDEALRLEKTLGDMTRLK